MSSKNCCVSFFGNNPYSQKEVNFYKYYICFDEPYRCFITKYQFMKRFNASCNNYASNNNSNQNRCQKMDSSNNNYLRSIFNELSYDKHRGIWKGFSYFFNLEFIEKGKPPIYKLQIHNGELRVYLLPENDERKEHLVFLLKTEDLQLDHNGDSIYPVSSFLDNFWRFYRYQNQYADFLSALQQIDHLRNYYPINADLDRFCVVIRVLGSLF